MRERNIFARRKEGFWNWLVFSGVLILLDQLSKHLALSKLKLHTITEVFWGLNFTLEFNRGAAFGFLANASGWQHWFFISIAVIVSLLIIFWLKTIKNNNYEKLALVMILSGAVGNLIDRIKFGYVIDFIDVYYKQWHWYTFNVADMAITIGAALLLLVVLGLGKRT